MTGSCALSTAIVLLHHLTSFRTIEQACAVDQQGPARTHRRDHLHRRQDKRRRLTNDERAPCAPFPGFVAYCRQALRPPPEARPLSPELCLFRRTRWLPHGPFVFQE